MGKLVIPEKIYRQVYGHLLRDNSEHLAFLLCNIGCAQGKPVFLARDMILVEDTDLSGPHRFSLDLKLEPLLAVINRAIKGRMALVEAHSHPFSDYPAFSLSDRRGFREFVPYTIDSIKGKPYGATVWGKQGIAGICWSAWPQKEQELRVTVVGDTLVVFNHRIDFGHSDMQRYDRQIRAFGTEMQPRINSLKVGVVGLGGTGCHVSQQLAYLGVRDFVIVDSQLVEDTNLNRLVGATPKDIGKPKVKVMGNWISRIAAKAKVQAIHADLRSPAVFDSLKMVDLIFGCVDNDGARLILNELSLAYLVPLIDCGVEIETEGRQLQQAGGRVNMVLPGGPCLVCMQQIDLGEARVVLSRPEEIRTARQMGYIRGEDEPSPAVVSINGVVASLAVTEFLNVVTGLRPPQPFVAYDMLGTGRRIKAQWVVPQTMGRVEDCFECGLTGVGDAVNLGRYVVGGHYQ
jgi:molybdopterin/thiamine biosynthesis adenylyltransferase